MRELTALWLVSVFEVMDPQRQSGRLPGAIVLPNRIAPVTVILGIVMLIPAFRLPRARAIHRIG